MLEWSRAERRFAGGQRSVRSVGIVGAGLMGTAIAAACVEHGLKVTITDSSPAAVDAAMNGIVNGIYARGKSYGAARQEVERLVTVTAGEQGMEGCDVVLESVIETPAAKLQVYARIEPRLGDDAVLASNTSTIPLARLARGLSSPERFVGIHFFHPVRQRPLVEIIRGPKTSDATVDIAIALARSIDKIPVVVGDGPGFLVNRMLVPYLTESLELLLEGATVEQIESAATEFGMAKGPLRLMDEIGLDTTLQAGRVLWEAFPDRVVASPLLISMVKSGRLGRKSGVGFFDYEDASRQEPPRKAMADLIATWTRGPREWTTDAILCRLLLPMVLEAARLLEEHVVYDPREIDLGALFGLGFPTARGGLLWWADTIGAGRLVELVRPLGSLGPRMTPPRLLQAMRAEGGRWHP